MNLTVLETSNNQKNKGLLVSKEEILKYYWKRKKNILDSYQRIPETWNTKLTN